MHIDLEQIPKVVDIELELLGSLLLKDGLVIPQVANILRISVHKRLSKV